MSKSLSFRVDYASKFIRMFMVLFIQLVLVNSLYSQTEDLQGWSIDQYYLLVGVYNVINYISWGLFNVNLYRVEEKVLKGEFDFLLLYPSGSIFSASFMEFFLDDVISSLSGFILIGYYFSQNWSEINLLSLIGFIIAVLSGVVIWFSIHLGAASMNFLSPRNGVMGFIKGMSRTASFPVDVFGEYLRIFLYTIFPVAFIAAVPSKLLSGVFSWEYVLLSLVIAFISLLLARMIWHFSLKMYSSSGG